jgi:serine/threonine-protein kinase Stk1
VHADVKPANIFLVREGRVVLIDFNVSQVDAKPGAACAPVAQGLRAKLHFSAHSLLHASPERIQSGRPSMADDVFSACCTVYELMEGAHPFGGKSALEAMKEDMRPVRPAGASVARWKLLRRGLSFDPGERPSAEQLWKGFSAVGFLRGFTL